VKNIELFNMFELHVHSKKECTNLILSLCDQLPKNYTKKKKEGKMSVAFSIEYFYISLIVYLLGSVILAVLFVISLFFLVQKWSNEEPWTTKLMWILEPLSIGAFMVTAIFSTFTRWHPTVSHMCLETAQVLGSSYGFAKAFMYAVMILRLQVAYGKSKEYSYPVFLLFGFLIYTLVVSTGTLFFSIFSTKAEALHRVGQWWCRSEFPTSAL
ncbi:hypothetical protein RFI_37521, partial [Reticulomyxa filosa]